MPESGQAKAIYLYQAVDFPYTWKRVHTILENCEAVDGTLLFYSGRWWLFCTSRSGEYRSFNSHLSIWTASDLFGEWHEHPKNPVKIDIRSARPAGGFFSVGKDLFRPAQDCSMSYGGAITINRVDKLSVSDFHETVVGTIRPPVGRYNEGIHTLSSDEGLHIVDIKRYVLEPKAIIAEMKAVVKRVALHLGLSEPQVQMLKRWGRRH
jgi:hypothetical protein